MSRQTFIPTVQLQCKTNRNRFVKELAFTFCASIYLTLYIFRFTISCSLWTNFSFSIYLTLILLSSVSVSIVKTVYISVSVLRVIVYFLHLFFNNRIVYFLVLCSLCLKKKRAHRDLQIPESTPMKVLELISPITLFFYITNFQIVCLYRHPVNVRGNA